MDILLATNNKNKVIELTKIFQFFNSKHKIILPNKNLVIEENQPTIEKNAEKKAKEYFKVFRVPVISDDSGLFVNALDGRPGVNSKRFAGDFASDQNNIIKLISEMEHKNDREAVFKTVLCYFDGTRVYFSKGELYGEITSEPRGNNGFGYDPIFQVNGLTLAELNLEEKSSISHRKKASLDMVRFLNEI